jgi:hypothetical protein
MRSYDLYFSELWEEWEINTENRDNKIQNVKGQEKEEDN